MSDITVERSASGVSVEPLREQVRGQVLTGEDAGYDEVRAVHNGMFSKWPLAVLRAEQVADVIAGVNFARDNGLELAVRNGGHSGPGFGTNDRGLVIDMTPMRTVHVDPRNKTARADAGATLGDFNHATHAFGLATTGRSSRGVVDSAVTDKDRQWIQEAGVRLIVADTSGEKR